MDDSQWRQRTLSRLTLGTVQLGMPYGVANRTGQPSLDEAREIIRVAFEGGVNVFDTAAAYGDSERTLGRALRELDILDQVTVVTKVRPMVDLPADEPSAAVAAIERSVADSRRHLGIDCLPLVLLHRDEDAAHVEVLRRLQRRGWLEHYGLSCGHDPARARRLLREAQFAAVQAPGNLLDPRHLRGQLFEDAKRLGAAVFLRSVYLQGLLAISEDQVPTPLRGVLPVRRRLEAIAAEHGQTLPEMALRYARTLPGVTSVVVGVETVEQMRDNLRLWDRGPLSGEQWRTVASAVPELPEQLITPHQWPS